MRTSPLLHEPRPIPCRYRARARQYPRIPANGAPIPRQRPPMPLREPQGRRARPLMLADAARTVSDHPKYPCRYPADPRRPAPISADPVRTADPRRPNAECPRKPRRSRPTGREYVAILYDNANTFASIIVAAVAGYTFNFTLITMWGRWRIQARSCSPFRTIVRLLNDRLEGLPGIVGRLEGLPSAVAACRPPGGPAGHRRPPGGPAEPCGGLSALVGMKRRGRGGKASVRAREGKRRGGGGGRRRACGHRRAPPPIATEPPHAIACTITLARAPRSPLAAFPRWQGRRRAAVSLRPPDPCSLLSTTGFRERESAVRSCGR